MERDLLAAIRALETGEAEPEIRRMLESEAGRIARIRDCLRQKEPRSE